MKMYDLIDNHLKNYYIKGTKYGFIAFLIATIVLGVLSPFYNFAAVLCIVIAVPTLVLLFKWRRNKTKYENKLSCSDKTVTVYNYKNQKVKEFKLDLMKSSCLKMAFDEYPRYSYKECLVLYNDIELYENMEYSSFWNDSNMLIIQNPFLIRMIEQMPKDVQQPK